MSFKSLTTVSKMFEKDETCIEYFERLRWKDGVVSPFDKDSKVYKCKGYKYKCKTTGKYFNVKTGTIFEDSNIKLSKWFVALYLLLHHSKGISSVQLAIDLGVTQKTAWFILHRLRYALKNGFNEPLQGTLEADETYVGGKDTNKHRSKLPKEGGYMGFSSAKSKKPVLGLVARNGQVRIKFSRSIRKEAIEPFIKDNAVPGSTVYTDEYYAYNGLGQWFGHDTIKHASKQYVRDDVHTNTIENFWSVLKRGVYGTYHQISEKHIQNYLDEFSFRFNTKGQPAFERFELFLCNASGKLDYETLIKKTVKEAKGL